ncbi:MAG TPA: S-formylglutathione hydrolase [Gammaproteobacteria bacterium]|nr:S-formylglutathione hydrolase [Gammaproteobacteria bacterium]
MAAHDGLETISEHRCFGGTVGYFRHHSAVNDCEMRFAVYTPPAASRGRVPVVTWLAGLTCTEETFMIKAGAQRAAAELGLMLVAPDTSPRGAAVPDAEDGAWELGLGAGFYVDATERPWSHNYRMHSYVAAELPEIIAAAFSADMGRQGICGHSMGGHGALVMGLRYPDVYRSVSAFAPIAAPSRCPWGRKAFTAYLGADPGAWADWDATELVRRSGDLRGRATILIDQGLDDQFLAAQLYPEAFEAACAEAGQALELRRHAGYDHGYFFIATFIEDHLRHHAKRLGLRDE